MTDPNPTEGHSSLPWGYCNILSGGASVGSMKPPREVNGVLQLGNDFVEVAHFKNKADAALVVKHTEEVETLRARVRELEADILASKDAAKVYEMRQSYEGIAAMVAERTAQRDELAALLGRSREYLRNAIYEDPNIFHNGNTAPGSTIDEGDVWFGQHIEEMDAALARAQAQEADRG